MKKLLLIILFFLTSCAYAPYVPYIRGGDCVDKVIKVRQSLKKQGYEARIILGVRNEVEGHAWVEYKDKQTGEWKIIGNYEDGY